MTTFFRGLWGILVLLSIGWMCVGFSVTSQSAQEVDAEYNDAQSEAASDLGVGVGASISLIFFVCTGLPAFLLSSVLYWRNGVKIREDKRHREQMDVLKQAANPRL